MALTDDLKAWWDGDDETDSHTGGYDLTEVNSPTYAAGKVGDAFQGAVTGNKHWKIANASAGDFDLGTDDFSVAWWVKGLTVSPSNDGIFEYGNANSTEAGLAIWSNETDKIIAYLSDGTTRISKQFSAGITNGAWSYCVLNGDRSGNAELFVDGVSIDTIDISSLVAANIQPSTDLLIAGATGQGANDRLIDSFGIWSRLLNIDERRWLYNRGAGRSYSEISDYSAPTQAAYSLEDEEDFHDGLVDLTNNGTVTFTTGKVGDAASFNGSSQRLSSDSLLYKDVGDEKISIDCWFKADTISSAMGIAGQSNSSYSLQLLGSGTLRFRTNHVTDGVKTVDWGSTLSAGVWYYVHAYHDPDTDTIGISVNDGTVVTTATGGNALVTRTDDWNIGSISSGNYFDGLIDQVRFLRGSILSSGDRTSTYNSGDGVEFSSGGATVEGTISEGAESGDTFTDVLTALATVADGAEAGDAFQDVLTALASISEGSESGDTFAAIVSSIVSGAISEGAVSSDSFSAIVGNIALVGDGAVSSDVFSTLLGAIETVSDGAVSSDAFAANLILGALISEGAISSDTFAFPQEAGYGVGTISFSTVASGSITFNP